MQPGWVYFLITQYLLNRNKPDQQLQYSIVIAYYSFRKNEKIIDVNNTAFSTKNNSGNHIVTTQWYSLE